jgi:hypothetical protein
MTRSTTLPAPSPADSMTALFVTHAQALFLARLIEQSSDSPAMLYPVAARLRSAANLDRCDDCGTLHPHAALDCIGDLAVCHGCGGVAPHPYRSGLDSRAVDAEMHDIPRFMAGHPIEQD